MKRRFVVSLRNPGLPSPDERELICRLQGDAVVEIADSFVVVLRERIGPAAREVDVGISRLLAENGPIVFDGFSIIGFGFVGLGSRQECIKISRVIVVGLREARNRSVIIRRLPILPETIELTETEIS